jgi:hypothetical protein
MKSKHHTHNSIFVFAFGILLMATFACGSNSRYVEVTPNTSLLPSTATPVQLATLNLNIYTPTAVLTTTPLLTPTITQTSTITPTIKPTFTRTATATPDLYVSIAGDYPNGIWDYIFNPQKGARGHLQIHIGEQKSLIFEIIGAANCSSMPSGQAYLVRYPNGNEEWKDRQAMEKLDLFVLKDELSDIFRDFNWQFFQCR